MNEKIEALFANEEFASKLVSCKEAAAVKALFTENGIEVTDEQCEAIVKELVSAAADGELDDAVLEGVAGGRISLKKIFKAVVKILKGGVNLIDTIVG